MMTVSEAERARRVAQKGRSASFCATGQIPLTLGGAHSSSDIRDTGFQLPQVFDFMQAANGAAAAQYSPQTRLKASSSHSTARRSQSCRVQGSRPPRVNRRYETPPGSAGRLDQNHPQQQQQQLQLHQEQQQQLHELQQLQQEIECKFFVDVQGTPPTGRRDLENGSYNPFLKKVGSCGRLVTLTPDDESEGSPTLRRSASARRPPRAGSPTQSPNSARSSKPSSVKGKAPIRRGGTPTSNSTKRAPHSGYLEVRTSAGSSEGLDPDAYLLRNFQTTNKGIVNRGDSFRRRRSRSNSIQPPFDGATLPSLPPQMQDIASVPGSPEFSSDEKDSTTEHFRMVVVGATGVGKTALMNQFRTSECINAYDCTSGEETEETVSIVLNNIESEIVFVNATTPRELQDEMQRVQLANGWLVVYSVTDKASFQRAADDLSKLQSSNILKGRAAILVGNKCELVRSRSVSYEDGRDLAISYGAKFMEISVGMNHKCDDLLVGILHQLRLKDEASKSESTSEEKEKAPWTRNRSLMRASMKAKRLVNRIIGKSDSKHRQCEDFLN
ncbi:UNVERIFIED_CONTAM: hypothetical protein RMT77_008997 [Armadillidium vulgare]